MAFLYLNTLKLNHISDWSQEDREYYVIHTFHSNIPKLVNKAIDYYYEKYMHFMRLADQQFSQNIRALVHDNQDIQSLFQEAFENYETNIGVAWQTLQNQNSSDLQTNLRTFREQTRQINDSCNNIIGFGAFLRAMAYNENVNYNEIPGTINLNNLPIDQFINTPAENIRQLAGLRSTIFGQIFEDGANSALFDFVNDQLRLLSFYQLGYLSTGNQKALLPPNAPNKATKIGFGKTDGMLFVDADCDGGLVEHYRDPVKNRGRYSTTRRHSIELEASEIYDLSSIEPGGDLYQAMKKYIEDPLRGGMLGITDKAWVGQTGSMGSFAYSANEINNRPIVRTPGRVSAYFTWYDDFQAYNVYVVAKYLINIIGAYNGIVSTGTQIIPTYNWLFNLYNISNNNRTRAIRHSVVGKNSDDGWEQRAKHNAQIYKVSNKLIVSYY